MRKKLSEFPWYLIYIPIIALVLIVWYLDVKMEVMFVDILKDFLTWLGVNEAVIVGIVVVAASITAVCSIIAHSLSGNKRLKNIEGVATTAPDRLDQSIQNTGKEICRTIHAQDEKLLRDVLEIKSSTASVQRQMENLHLHQEGVPVQMDQMIGYINRLYLCHDRDQKKIQSLKAENEKLRKRNRELEDQLSLCRGDDYEYGD